jgi:hypothetical protein
MANGLNKAADNFRSAVRNTITRISNWFGPLQPLIPFAPKEAAGRQREYQIGENAVLRTRETGRPSVALLRAFAENCDIVRLIIETRKDQVEGLEWEIVARDNDKKPKPGAKPDPRIEELTKFFRKPDGQHRWGVWIRALLEDMFVCDAMALMKVRDRVDRLHSLLWMDGTTLKVLNDGFGRVPQYPDPSYQQILYGMPATDYTTQEILYAPRTMRTWSAYGLSVVEQILITIETMLNRTTFNANYYKDGNMPAGLIFADSTMTSEQIEAFNNMLDDMLSGDLKKRRKMLTVPGAKGKFQEIREPPLKDDFDEWLARIACYAFSVSPAPFIKTMNRASAENANEVALAEGLRPIVQWIEGWHNDIIEEEFGYDDLIFAVKTQQDMDPQVAAEIRASDVKNAIITIDEAREQIGLEPRGGAADELGVVTMQGFTPIEMGVDAQQQQNDAKLDAIKNPKPIGVMPNGQPAPNQPADPAAATGGKKPAGKPVKKYVGSKKKNFYHSTDRSASQHDHGHEER